MLPAHSYWHENTLHCGNLLCIEYLREAYEVGKHESLVTYLWWVSLCFLDGWKHTTGTSLLGPQQQLDTHHPNEWYPLCSQSAQKKKILSEEERDLHSLGLYDSKVWFMLHLAWGKDLRCDSLSATGRGLVWRGKYVMITSPGTSTNLFHHENKAIWWPSLSKCSRVTVITLWHYSMWSGTSLFILPNASAGKHHWNPSLSSCRGNCKLPFRMCHPLHWHGSYAYRESQLITWIHSIFRSNKQSPSINFFIWLPII